MAKVCSCLIMAYLQQVGSPCDTRKSAGWEPHDHRSDTALKVSHVRAGRRRPPGADGQDAASRTGARRARCAMRRSP